MKNILNKFKSIFSSKKNKGVSTINPHKHWIILLVVFFITILLFILWSFYLLYDIKRGVIYDSNSVIKGKAATLQQKNLDNVTKIFNDKSQKEKEIMQV